MRKSDFYPLSPLLLGSGVFVSPPAVMGDGGFARGTVRFGQIQTRGCWGCLGLPAEQGSSFPAAGHGQGWEKQIQGENSQGLHGKLLAKSKVSFLKHFLGIKTLFLVTFTAELLLFCFSFQLQQHPGEG